MVSLLLGSVGWFVKYPVQTHAQVSSFCTPAQNFKAFGDQGRAQGAGNVLAGSSENSHLTRQDKAIDVDEYWYWSIMGVLLF